MRNFLSIKFTVSILLFLASCSSKDKGNEQPFIPSVSQIDQKVNFYKRAEEFRYKVKYGFMSGGEVTVKTDTGLTAYNTIPCYKVNMRVRAKGAVDMFTTFDDEFVSYIDTTSLLPQRFTRNLKEAKYRKIEETLFDRVASKANVNNQTDPKNIVRYTYQISPFIHDVISSYFVFRNLPFETMQIGDTTYMDIFLDDRSHNIKVVLKGKETISTENKKLSCWIVAPYLNGSGNFEGKEAPVLAWISDDERRVPVKVKANLDFGGVVLDLSYYKAYKYYNGFKF